MVKDIQNLKVKLQMLGKNVLDTNSFALLTQEQSSLLSSVLMKKSPAI